MKRIVLGLAAALAILGIVAAGPALQPGVDKPAEAADSIGSLRGAKVAFPMPPGERAKLVFLAGPMPEAERAAMAAAAPNVTIVTVANRDEALGRAAEAHGVDARFATPELIARAPHLVWVQAMSAGVDHLLANKALSGSDRIVLTNMRAVHGPAIADHAMAMLLTLTRNMKQHLRNQAEGNWPRDDGPEGGGRATALAGKTMLVVGLGGIGTEIAQRAGGFGMRVIATRRTDTPSPAFVQKTGKPEDLMSMLPEADVVAICVPLTSETKGLIGRDALAKMKPSAILINIARGKVIDTGALVEALRSQKVGGACLDVTDPEPLPADHPLWKMPNVVITPHTAADAEVTDQRRWALFRENVRRFGAGEPLMNVVDKRAGY